MSKISEFTGGLSIKDVFDSAVSIEKAKIGARLGATGQQQAAGLNAVPVSQDAQARASSYTAGGGVFDRYKMPLMVGGGLVLMAGVVYAVKKALK